MNKNRVERILSALKEMGLTQMLVTDPMCVCYLTVVQMNPC